MGLSEVRHRRMGLVVPGSAVTVEVLRALGRPLAIPDAGSLRRGGAISVS